jgi:hypothetical protein
MREDLLLCSSYLPLGVPNWADIYTPSRNFSGAVAREKEDFCKGSLSLPIFYFVIFLLYFTFACIFLSELQKISSFIVVIFTCLLLLARMRTHENTKLCDFTSTNNNDFICTLMTHKYRGCIIVLSINKSAEPNEEQKVLTSSFDQGFTVNTSKQVFRGIW